VYIQYLFTLKKLYEITSKAISSASFSVISHARVKKQLSMWTTHLPTVKPFYAVKCNHEPKLLSWLAQGGTGFDCASAREIRALDVLGNPEIIFANPCKKNEDIISSGVRNIQTTVIDSNEEIDKQVENDWRGKSFMRLRVDDAGSVMPFSAKFGASITEIPSIAKYAKLKGQELSGVSFHVGSGCTDVTQYRNAIKAANFAVSILKDAGHDATTIDIGGGFTNTGFIEASAVIRRMIPLLPTKLRMIAEPGRFFAETSHDLFVRVIGRKPALKGPGYRYTVDESLYGQFSCIPYDYAKPRWIRVREPGSAPRKKVPGVLYGRTCDSLDMIAASNSAEELLEGDWLWFPNMGAYTSVTSTEFNGFPRPYLMPLEENSSLQLPSPNDFSEGEWASGLQYVTPVKVPVYDVPLISSVP